MSHFSFSTISIYFVACLLCSCGGGASKPSNNSTLPSGNLSKIISDTAPEGTKLDLRNLNYFPAGDGDIWNYDIIQDGVTRSNILRRSIIAINVDEFSLSENFSSSYGDSTTRYRRDINGYKLENSLGIDAPQIARDLMGEWIEYPQQPFYTIGGTRQIIRQGNWGKDLDGDGAEESFRFETSQKLVAFEKVDLPFGRADAIHFHTVSTLTLSYSNQSNGSKITSAIEESWWVSGIGLVRAERELRGTDGTLIQKPYTLVFTSGKVSDRELFSPTIDGTLTKVTLDYSSMVFDKIRNVYYATIPENVSDNGNRIATINSITGQITYSNPIGSDPSSLAISSDGSALVVGLSGSGEVVKLRLPDMLEQWRTPLLFTDEPVWIRRQRFAANISISPKDTNVVAIAMGSAGVALIRNGILQPKIANGYAPTNLITFDGGGVFLYGYNTGTSEHGLRRFSVDDDGLTETLKVLTDQDSIVWNIDFTNQGLILGRGVYRSADLTLLGKIDSTEFSRCRSHAAISKLVCLESGFGSKLALLDPATLKVSSIISNQPYYSVVNPIHITPGPAGQVALRVQGDYLDTQNPLTRSKAGFFLFNSLKLK